MKEIHGFCIWGMWGPVTDPGEVVMTRRMGSEIPGINVHASPYRDYQINDIVQIVMGLPPTAIVLICGTSLGANNAPITGAYIYKNNPRRIVHGIWGFQASVWGAQAGQEPTYPGITSNVLFAHLTTSELPTNFGLGAYRWIKAPGNTVTGYDNSTVNDPHPGDENVTVQNAYLAEMKRIIATAQAAP